MGNHDVMEAGMRLVTCGIECLELLKKFVFFFVCVCVLLLLLLLLLSRTLNFLTNDLVFFFLVEIN